MRRIRRKYSRWGNPTRTPKETRSPQKAIEVTIIVETGIQNLLIFLRTPAYLVFSSIINPSINNFQKSWSKPWTNPSSYEPTLCFNCGYTIVF